MLDQLKVVFTASAWWSYVLRIGCFYILAWLIHRLAPWMAGCLMRLVRFTPSMVAVCILHSMTLCPAYRS